MEENIILLSDSYKYQHFSQYPPKTEKVYSYFASRGGKFSSTKFFGLQMILMRYLVGQVVTKEKIDEAELIINVHLGPNTFNRTGWEYILDKYEGRLPVSIRAVPEGKIVETGNILMTVENTDPNCFWLTNFLESLLVQIWYPTTVCSMSSEIRKLIERYLIETGDPSLIDFKLHDFGFRGVSSVESAGIGGVSHLVNFMGTDTVAALVYAKRYYDCDMAGFSIPASEHSTITSWGKEGEVDAFANMLTNNPTGLVACVSDSYDIYHACRELWGNKLRDQIIARDGTLVIRPDSGEPVVVIKRVLDILWERFGGTTNDKGYKVLDSHVRVIQGDGVNLDAISDILLMMKDYGWSADNIAFGMGGGLLQQLDRDTQKFAFKCSSVTVDGEERDVWKEPITDPGKNSLRGKLKLIEDSEGLVTVNQNQSGEDVMQNVFRNGKLLVKTTLDNVRLLR